MANRVCIVMAHCDDELIFGWPILLGPDRGNVSVLICSSDETNAERKWCQHRKHALAEVCDLLGVRHICLPFPAQFYKLPHRPENMLQNFANTVQNTLADFEPDYVFTHNPHGEYGHFDHRFLAQMLDEVTTTQKWFTDMYHRSNWPLGPRENVLSPLRGYRADRTIKHCVMTEQQLDLYKLCKKIYDRHGVWTWSDDVIQSCSLYWR